MSFPTSFAALADLIHRLVRNTVKTKLNSRTSPARISSSISTNRKSRKLDSRLLVRRVVTTDMKVKNLNTAIFIASVTASSD